jgi:hypothetical protein
MLRRDGEVFRFGTAMAGKLLQNSTPNQRMARHGGAPAFSGRAAK